MGDTNLQRSLAAMIGALSGASLQECTEAAAAPILQEAQLRAPARTGRLRSKLRIVSRHSERHATSTVEVAESASGGDEHQAVFVEYGTVKMAAEPFMRPAAAAGEAAALAAFEGALTNKLKAL